MGNAGISNILIIIKVCRSKSHNISNMNIRNAYLSLAC